MTTPTAGQDIVVDDFSDELDDHGDRLTVVEADRAALAAEVRAYMGVLSTCIQRGEVADTPDGGARIAIAFNATMPNIPTVVACLGDHTVEVLVEVEHGSETTTGCNVFVFNLDGSFGTDLVRINWHATCDFPDPGSIS